MTYRVKEIFYSLQGEGAYTGRAAVFCRFTSCNLWTGREADRPRAVCRFCDTDFTGMDGPGGGRFGTAGDLAAAVTEVWAAGAGGFLRGTGMGDRVTGLLNVPGITVEPAAAPARPSGRAQPFVVCTGGEPLLQLGDDAVQAMQSAGFEVAVETNGTLPAPPSLDWICVSPKAGTELRQVSGDELKLVYPQAGAPPEMFEDYDFGWLYLQPMDGPQLAENTRRAVAYCLAHPQWRLSLQTHKTLGIP